MHSQAWKDFEKLWANERTSCLTTWTFLNDTSAGISVIECSIIKWVQAGSPTGRKLAPGKGWKEAQSKITYGDHEKQINPQDFYAIVIEYCDFAIIINHNQSQWSHFISIIAKTAELLKHWCRLFFREVPFLHVSCQPSSAFALFGTLDDFAYRRLDMTQVRTEVTCNLCHWIYNKLVS